jgi:hypothetical protein
MAGNRNDEFIPIIDDQNSKKITAHLINIWMPWNSHSEIILEESTEDGPLYYRINPWSEPKDEALLNEKDCKRMLERASERQEIIIHDHSMTEIIDGWKSKYDDELENFSCCGYNCSDVCAWFLEEYANVPKPNPCSKPVTWNLVCCGLFAPSFLQCCTLGGRIFDYTKSVMKNTDTSAPTEKTKLTEHTAVRL